MFGSDLVLLRRQDGEIAQTTLELVEGMQRIDPAAINGNDPTLGLVPYGRRPTLIAVSMGDPRYRFDIRLAGNGETVFFEC